MEGFPLLQLQRRVKAWLMAGRSVLVVAQQAELAVVCCSAGPWRISCHGTSFKLLYFV